jgi:hypothetical protein
MIANITAPIAIGQASSYYTLTGAEGFGSGGVEVVKWDRPGFQGIKTPRAFWRERIMRMVVNVRADTSALYETKRRDLEEAFDTPRNGLTLLKFTTVSGLSLQSYCHLNSEIQSPFVTGEVTIGNFRIELIAEDPIFYSQTLTETDVTFAAGSGNITNSGNSSVFPVVRVHGNVQNPVITNNYLGRTVSLGGYTIGAGRYIDIDMLNETIVDETGVSVYSYVDQDDFFWLAKGSNTVTISGTVGGSGYRKATFSFRSGYLGV